MAQIKTEILSRLSAPHLKGLKKAELLDLYQRVHAEYAKQGPSAVEHEEEQKTQSPMATVREIQIPTLPQRTTRKRIIRDEQGRILEVVEEPL